MTWAGAITAIEAHMTTAGTAHGQRGGEPGVPSGKVSAWYYTGSGINELIPETLTDHPFSEGVSVRFYWPVATRDSIPARTLELEVRQVTRAFIAALEGDRSLGDNVEVLTISDAEAGWLEADGAAWRIVTVPLALGFTDSEPIAR